MDLKAFSTRLVTLSRTTMKSTLKEAWQEDRVFQIRLLGEWVVLTGFSLVSGWLWSAHFEIGALSSSLRLRMTPFND